MDSFHEPSSSRMRAALATPLADVQRHIAALAAERKRRGVPLSGRVVHVAHYLPLTAALIPPKDSVSASSPRTGVPSPPLTPPVRPSDAGAPPLSPATESQQVSDDVVEDANAPKWTLAPRAGHSAMVSGILGLAAGAGATEQIVVGWVGDLYRQLPPGEPQTPALSAVDIGVASPGSEAVDANANTHTQMDPEAGADSPPSTRGFAKLPAKNVTEPERAALEKAFGAYVPQEEYPKDQKDEEDRKNVSFVPVWLDDDIAHGHYDGYCKTSALLHTSSHCT